MPRLSLALLLFAALVLPAIAAPAPAPASVAGLSAADVAELKKTKTRILIPTFIPPGYRLQSATADVNAPFGTRYQIKYVGPDNSDFTVGMVIAKKDIGDGPQADKQYPYDCLFGKGQLNWMRGMNESPDAIWSGWLNGKPWQVPAYCLEGHHLPPEVAVKIVNSLAWLDDK